jgi:hypothetical protein
LYQGWHLDILFRANILPLKTPNSSIDSIAYWEQVGVNLHEGGNNGDMKYL